ncbi:hypothetical protein V1477_017580 [Vespula maculifrons]|uniref:Uncharacterized protein n=1 Tax=Vespula maculifrons TaxID=7453 RepID=A0ABD2B6F9_VESMC
MHAFHSRGQNALANLIEGPTGTYTIPTYYNVIRRGAQIEGEWRNEKDKGKPVCAAKYDPLCCTGGEVNDASMSHQEEASLAAQSITMLDTQKESLGKKGCTDETPA